MSLLVAACMWLMGLILRGCSSCSTATAQPHCPDGDFECNDGGCINVTLRCDGSFDCTDHSDEINCTSKHV